MMQGAMSQDDATVVRLEAAQAQLRDHFLGWQCRIRQMSMRESAGRPTAGMRPDVTVGGESQPLGAITVLIIKQDPTESTAQFRHAVQRTHDPVERWESAVKTMQAAYYQRAREFSDQLTALFGPKSAAAQRLSLAGTCRLDFAQYNQRYRIPCKVRALAPSDLAFQATYWHNHLFNPNLPGDVTVLGFAPDWAHASADPPVG